MPNEMALALRLAGFGLAGVFSTLAVFYIACRVLRAMFSKKDTPE